MRAIPIFIFLGCLFDLTGCVLWRQTLWVYTSLPKEVLTEMAPALERAVPEARVKWVQGSSETVQTRIAAEAENSESKADLVLTGDPVWYEGYKREGNFLPYASPAAQAVPQQLRDPSSLFTTVRVSAMVLAYHSQLSKDLPTHWKDLTGKKWDRKLSMGDPLTSSASFIALGVLQKLYGWQYWIGLKKLSLVAEGNSESVLSRIAGGERTLGFALLENIIRANVLKAVPVRPIYPLDGAILVPGPIAILKSTDHPELAEKVYDWFFSPAAQGALIHYGMYSPLPGFVSPNKARIWQEMWQNSNPWSPEWLAELFVKRDEIRAHFSDIVLH